MVLNQYRSPSPSLRKGCVYLVPEMQRDQVRVLLITNATEADTLRTVSGHGELMARGAALATGPKLLGTHRFIDTVSASQEPTGSWPGSSQ